MSRCFNKSILLTCVFAITCLTTHAQSLRTIPAGGGLGHLVHGVGNEPLRLSNDALAIVSDGMSEGSGLVDDQIVIVSGYESGLVSTSTVNLCTALGVYGDLARTLVRLDDKKLVYVDRGPSESTPSLVVVSDAGGSNLVFIHALPAGDGFDVDLQRPAVLDASTMVWTTRGLDGVLGTADDRIGFTFGLGTAGAHVGSIPAGGAIGPEVTAVGRNRAVARHFGPDGLAGTPDDALLLLSRGPRSFTTALLPLRMGVGVFAHLHGPAVMHDDALVYPAAGLGAVSLYVLVRNASGPTPVVVPVGTPLEIPAGSSLVPQPVGFAPGMFAYSNAGQNRTLHDTDDEVRVCVFGRSTVVHTFSPGFGLGFSDPTIPPANLGGGRLVFGSHGSDALQGTADDGVVVAEALETDSPTFTLVTSGVGGLSLVGVNDSTVALQALDGSLAFFQGLGTSNPGFSQFVESIGCGACFTRLNDWTLCGTSQVSSDPANLADDIVTVQFPFVELIGEGSVCSSGQRLVVSRDVRPDLGTNWPATMRGGATGMPAALMLSWYEADLPLNAVARFYLDPAWLFRADLMLVDVSGDARAYLYLEPLPWLPGFSFCGQWGVVDFDGYQNVCVSSGFRVHF